MKSLKTIFNEVYGEGLAEYGFKKVSGKYPYFARVVGDEIVQVITYRTVSSCYRDCRCFAQMCGVMTVYRENFQFDKEPGLSNVGYGELMEFVREISISENYMDYCTKDEEYMEKTMFRSLENCKKYFIPALNEIKSLKDCMDFYFQYNFYEAMKLKDYFNQSTPDLTEGMLYYKCFDECESKAFMKKKYEKDTGTYEEMLSLAKTESQRNHYMDSIETAKNKYHERISLLNQAFHNEDKMQYIQKIMEERKQRNTEELRKYKLL